MHVNTSLWHAESDVNTNRNFSLLWSKIHFAISACLGIRLMPTNTITFVVIRETYKIRRRCLFTYKMVDTQETCGVLAVSVEQSNIVSNTKWQNKPSVM